SAAAAVSAPTARRCTSPPLPVVVDVARGHRGACGLRAPPPGIVAHPCARIVQAPAAARAAGSAHAGAGVVLGERVARGGALGGIALLEHRVRILLHVLHRCLEVVLPSGEVLGELLGRVLLRGGDQIEPGLCVLDGVHTGDQRGVDDGGGAGVVGEGGAVLVG